MDERRRTTADQPGSGQEALPGAFRLGYPLLRGRWDEMVTGHGALRPHWEPFIEALSALPDQEMQSRWEGAQRLIRENGVTYNVYGDPRGLDRPWQLDPVPLLIAPEEWKSIEAALVQRASLMNHILADLYGNQDMLLEGMIPPALVYANPAYLRPLRHAAVPGGVHLHLYAVDIARDENGQWWVMADRCEAPSGVGYALENRAIVSRTLSDIMRTLPVEPLAPFVQKLSDALNGLTPRNRETPRSVLLTPGPYNETYFEHAYLARQLGFTLVESEDLTVRDSRVFLKTLDGLQPVDIILRRTDGAFCDPVELRGDSALGIAGLVQAVRRGTVVVANSLGSGVLEGGALAPFLPGLCRRLLGEDLSMPTVPTWWCGGEAECEHVLSRMDKLVIKAALPGGLRMIPQFGERLTKDKKAELIAAIRRRPKDFIGQERPKLSSAPVWSKGGEMEPRPTMLRVFLAAHDGGYVAMPGGLPRVAAESGGAMVSMQQGGGSKDTWVQAERHDRPIIAHKSLPVRVKLVRGSLDLPSRVADNLFWFGRYVERAEDTTRLLRAALSRAGSSAGFGAAEELPVALELLRRVFKPPQEQANEVAAIARMAFDPEHGVGLHATVERVGRMASLVRDRLSADTWRAVSRLSEAVKAVGGNKLRPNIQDKLAALNDVILAGEALSGLAMENMTRGLSWRFVDIGRRLERAVHVVDLLSGVLAHEDGVGGPELDVLLEISDSSITYRSRYLSSPQFAPVLDLLLADESNPRSLAFQLAALGTHMEHLAANRRATFYGPLQRQTIWLTGAVRTADIEALCRPDEDGERRNLDGFLEVLRSKMWELSETLTREYFTHAVSRSSAPATMPMPLYDPRPESQPASRTEPASGAQP
ncbi:MAG TPA: circularly permuted type 2 ATP-grasp protein [Candidatus Sulfotelmatobacter sp.]|jgi:uncharacterized circularly permuted ATP-grasp superfamily protein/uncharacterized alpha-E superfamily protein|nr:circularly permuted type 2 ATP-grasp protein [Candidatus Sulfotelmatobacter sp.]